MNPELLKPVSNKLVNQQHKLANVCFNLAFRLTGERWHKKEVRNTQLTRTLGEEIGEELMLGTRTINSIYSEITAEFHASKREFDEAVDGSIDLDYYRLSLSSRQTVQEYEVPTNILDEIFDGGDDDETYDPDHQSDGSILDYTDRDSLDDLEIEKETMVEYGVNHIGEIDEYKITHTYFFDDEEVYSTEYDNEESTRLVAPIYLDGEEEPIELRPVIYQTSTNEGIIREVEHVDVSFIQLIEDETFNDALKLDQPAHRRQALSILALVTANIFDIRDLAR
jgi:hypothetical protein